MQLGEGNAPRSFAPPPDAETARETRRSAPVQIKVPRPPVATPRSINPQKPADFSGFLNQVSKNALNQRFAETPPEVARFLQLNADKHAAPDGSVYYTLKDLYNQGAFDQKAQMIQSIVRQHGEQGIRAFAALSRSLPGFPFESVAPETVNAAKRYAQAAYQDTGAVLSDHMPTIQVLTPQQRNQFNSLLKENGIDHPEQMPEGQVISLAQNMPHGILASAVNDVINYGRGFVGVPLEAAHVTGLMGTYLKDLATGDTADASKIKAEGQAFNRGLWGGIKQPYERIASGDYRWVAGHPVSTLGAILPVAKAAGLGAGAAEAGLRGGFLERPAETQLRSIAGEHSPVLEASYQQPYARDLFMRGAQQTRTAVLGAPQKEGAAGVFNRPVRALQGRAFAKQSQAIAGQALQRGIHLRDEVLGPVQKARSAMKGHEERAATAYFQGVAPEDLAKVYRNANMKDAAELWEKIAKDNPGPEPSARQAAWGAAMHEANARVEPILQQALGMNPRTMSERPNIVPNWMQEQLSEPQQVPGEPGYFAHRSIKQNPGSVSPPLGGDVVGGRRAQEIMGMNNLDRMGKGTWNPDPRVAEQDLATKIMLGAHHEGVENFVQTLREAPAGIEVPHGMVALKILPSGGVGKAPLKGQLSAAMGAALRSQEGTGGSEEGRFAGALHSLEVQSGGTTTEPTMLAPVRAWQRITGEADRAVANQDRGAVAGGIRKAGLAYTNAFKTLTLRARPAWLVNNTTDTTFRAMVGGAGPADFVRAMSPKTRAAVAEIAPEIGYGAKSDVMRLSPEATLGRRIAESPPGRAGAAFTGSLTKANTAQENYARTAVFLSKAIPAAKWEVAGHNPFRYVRTSVNDAMRYLADGNNPKAAVIVHRAMSSVEDHMGGTSSHISDAERILVPFSRWYRFIVPYLLYKLPVHYPIRTALIQQFGQLGIQHGFQMGALPPWFTGAMPGGTQQDQKVIDDVLGTKATHTVGHLFSTQPLLGTSTLYQMMGNNPNNIGGNIAGNLVSPLVEGPLSAALGASQPTDIVTGSSLPGLPKNPTLQDRIAYAAQQVLANISPLSQFVPPTAPAPLSLISRNPTKTLVTPKGATTPPFAQPQRSELQRALGYMTGINVRPFDYTLNELQGVNSVLTQWTQPGRLPEFERKNLVAMQHNVRILMNRANTTAESKAAGQKTRLSDAKLLEKWTPVFFTMDTAPVRAAWEKALVDGGYQGDPAKLHPLALIKQMQMLNEARHAHGQPPIPNTPT